MTSAFVRGRLAGQVCGHGIILIRKMIVIIVAVQAVTACAAISSVVEVAVQSPKAATTTSSTRACTYRVRGHIGPVVSFVGLRYIILLGYLLSLWQGWVYGKELQGKTWSLIELESYLSVGKTQVATFIVYLTGILSHLGLASTTIVVPKEFHAYINLTISVVPIVTIITVIIVTTSATLK